MTPRNATATLCDMTVTRVLPDRTAQRAGDPVVIVCGRCGPVGARERDDAGRGRRETVTPWFDEISTWAPNFVAAIRLHYPGSRGAPPGKKMAWQIVCKTGVCGYIGLGEPSYKLAPRRRLGIQDARPLPHTVCCFIYWHLPAKCGERSSAHLQAWHGVAGSAWRERYGWAPLHWETMVRVVGENPGACFRRAGYRSLGLTTGRSARRPAGKTRGPRVWMDSDPKLVLYRGPLARLPK